LSTTYPQLRLPENEQLVGCLWIIGGHLREIPHGESKPALNAMNDGSRRLILSKFGMRQQKMLANTNFKNIFL
jgi:hypothetical protein